MKATLRGLFKSYGEVLDVVAHNNLRMRGQAFVSFTSIEHAKKAMKDIQRFPLYSKPIVSYRYFYAYNADFFLLWVHFSKSRLRRHDPML